jgi:hypothetical protein
MNPPTAEHIWQQIVWLFVLAIPVGCVAWTVTHEEIFREPREYCKRCSQQCRSLAARKFFYLFTCEYCFSHYIAALFIAITRFRLLLDDWRGYLLSFFAMVFVANIYMSLYSRLRVDIRSEKAAADLKETERKAKEGQAENENGKEGAASEKEKAGV